MCDLPLTCMYVYVLPLTYMYVWVRENGVIQIYVRLCATFQRNSETERKYRSCKRQFITHRLCHHRRTTYCPPPPPLSRTYTPSHTSASVLCMCQNLHTNEYPVEYWGICSNFIQLVMFNQKFFCDFNVGNTLIIQGF